MPRGRRKGNPDTRAEILAAARAEFGERGYDRATVRSIAARASVDPALVMHYFGSKERLFAESLDVPVSPADVLRGVFESTNGPVGEVLIQTMLSHWDAAPNTSSFVAVLRSATGEGPVHDQIREYFHATVLAVVEERIGGPEARLRAGAIGSQIAGLLLARYLLELEPVVEASPDDIARLVGPTIDRYLGVA